ncbi:MAG: glycosyltransferase family 4 protein [Planctomycetaceae bacterium]|nr:glycosyltransferase family 4 protein [Planctomycetaceae bacterium]
MNVLFLIPNWPAPSELWLHRMIEAIEPSTVAIATFAPGETTWRGRVPAVDLLPGLSGPARKLKLTSLAPGIGNRSLRRVLEQYKVDAVFCHYVNCALNFQRVWDTTSVPLFVHCHGYDVTWDYRLPWFPHVRVFGKGYKNRIRRLAERAKLVANSHFTRQRLEAAGIPGERIIVKYIGVHVPDAYPQQNSDTEFEVLYLGRLVDFKGPDLTMRAFELACEQGFRGKLTIAGDGMDFKKCSRLVHQSRFASRIDMLGVVSAEQGASLRARASIFTAHNRVGPITLQEEAYGVSVVEAMAAGIPVVTGSNGGVCETVVDGETGILFEPGDVAAHAEALLRLANDAKLRATLGSGGWHRARKCFSLDREAAQLRSMFEID